MQLKKPSLNHRLMECCVSPSRMGRLMKISRALFEYRYNKTEVKYADLVQLAKTLDFIIYKLIIIRDETVAEAVHIQNENQKHLKYLKEK